LKKKRERRSTVSGIEEEEEEKGWKKELCFFLIPIPTKIRTSGKRVVKKIKILTFQPTQIQYEKWWVISLSFHHFSN